jgi:hypothetical protein
LQSMACRKPRNTRGLSPGNRGGPSPERTGQRIDRKTD